MKLGEKISLLRKERGYTQEQLASQLNITRQTLSKWESGLSSPDIDSLNALAKIFGKEPSYFLDDPEGAAPLAAPNKAPHILGVLSIVLGALGNIAGLILGIVGIKKSKEEKDKKLNRIGIIVSSICLVVYFVLGFVAGFAIVRNIQAQRTPSHTSSAPASSSLPVAPKFDNPDLGSTLSPAFYDETKGSWTYWTIAITVHQGFENTDERVFAAITPMAYNDHVFSPGESLEIYHYNSHGEFSGFQAARDLAESYIAPAIGKKAGVDFVKSLHAQVETACKQAFTPVDLSYISISRPSSISYSGESVGYYSAFYTCDDSYSCRLSLTVNEYCCQQGSEVYLKSELITKSGLPFICPQGLNPKFQIQILTFATAEAHAQFEQDSGAVYFDIEEFTI